LELNGSARSSFSATFCPFFDLMSRCFQLVFRLFDHSWTPVARMLAGMGSPNRPVDTKESKPLS